MEHIGEIARSLFGMFIWNVLPWGLGALSVSLVLSHTPFGQELIAFFRSRRRDSELLEAVLHDLGDVRQQVLEIAERLDSAEQRLLRERNPGRAVPDVRRAPDEIIPTPH